MHLSPSIVSLLIEVAPTKPHLHPVLIDESRAIAFINAKLHTTRLNPGGGIYSRSPYVRSFVCTLPKSVATP